MSNFLARVLELPTEGPNRERKGLARETISNASPSKGGPSGPTGPRAAVTWPQECLQSEGRFGGFHARLFPLVGRKVQTPSGPGLLLQAFAGRAAVNVSGKIVFLRPDRVLPTEASGMNVSGGVEPLDAVAVEPRSD